MNLTKRTGKLQDYQAYLKVKLVKPALRHFKQSPRPGGRGNQRHPGTSSLIPVKPSQNNRFALGYRIPLGTTPALGIKSVNLQIYF